MKNKETLEEVAERILFENTKNVEIRYRGGRDSVIKSMLDIAKWQQEQDKNKYSEEEVIELLHSRMRYTLGEDYKEMTTIDWFEQYKKK
jgi:hypothetical protein